jgi:type II secretory ATPase GspE/PulE/Tfp pilus assembly ATPase PilB-like protein
MEGIKSVDYKKEIKRLVTRDFDSGIFVYTVIFRAFEANASEIHIEPTEDLLRIRYKIDGIYFEYFSKPMSLYPSIMAQLEAIIKSGNTSGDGGGPFSIDVMDQVIRVNVHFAPTIYGKSVVLTLYLL